MANGSKYGKQFSDDFDSGVMLFLRSQGIKNEREQQLWLKKIRESQMQTEGLKRQTLEQQIKLGQEPISKYVEPELEETALPEYQPGMGMAPYAPGATETRPTGKYKLNIPQGASMSELGNIQKAAELYGIGRGEEEYTLSPGAGRFRGSEKIAEMAMKPESLTEVNILSLPPDDPRQINYLRAKKELQKAGGLTKAAILALDPNDQVRKNYIAGEMEIREKDPYFQAVGIIEATNELIGFDTRTMQTRRVPIPGMPIKPGTVKSVNPIQQFIADALKETGKYKIEGEGEGKPSASANKGKILKDTTTGKRYQSDGVNWIPIP